MTPEQKIIIELPPSARLLVTAGPGTGKTHVLIGRLAHLVGSHRLNPGSEIAVLTFSRGAVREIRERAVNAAGDVGYVRAVTFDSFATRLLAECLPEGDWSGRSYDDRIQASIELIGSDDTAQQRIREFSHVFVDEMQDLVGVRANLVKTIVENCSGGFTLLGDPAQGIYNFQLEGPARREGSAELYRWLRKRFIGQLQEATLSKNHRAKTKAAETALWAGPLINGSEPNYESIRTKLQTAVLSLPCLGNLETACGGLQHLANRTAILCCTNGQSLMISRKLHEAGVVHTLQRQAVDRVLPMWIGLLLAGHEHNQIGRTAFLQRGETIFDREKAEAGWILLQRAVGGRGTTLNLVQLAERIRSGNVPDDLIDLQNAQLIVSTIHRAKGREFDRVILASDKKDFTTETPDELAEEARLLYVALTRPKLVLQHMQVQEFKGLYKKAAADRWMRQFGYKVQDVEVRGNDVHQDDPAGGFLLEDCDPLKTQRYLAEHVHPGEPVTLRYLKSSQNGEPRVFYSIEHNSQPVGITSEGFGATLHRMLKINRGWEVTWPASIENLRVEAVDTVAGSAASGVRCGLGASGIWLRVRVSGLGALHF